MQCGREANLRPAAIARHWLIVASACALVLFGASGSGRALAPPTATPTPWSPRCEFAPMPDAGPPGSLVGVGGLCYPLHSGRQGAIFFDDVLVGRVSGDTPGNYGTPFRVPDDATLGVHRVSLRYGRDGGPGIIASAPFTVLPFCRGDCDDNGAVTIDELLRGIAIALGRHDAGTCPLLDTDRNGVIVVEELVGAVGTALTGCLVPFIATATPTPTPTLCGDPNVIRLFARCQNTETETDCVSAGGAWTTYPFSGMKGCLCPTGQGGCLCTASSDCVGRCFATSNARIDRCSTTHQGTCSTQEPQAGCWCEFGERGHANGFCNDP